MPFLTHGFQTLQIRKAQTFTLEHCVISDRQSQTTWLGRCYFSCTLRHWRHRLPRLRFYCVKKLQHLQNSARIVSTFISQLPLLLEYRWCCAPIVIIIIYLFIYLCIITVHVSTEKRTTLSHSWSDVSKINKNQNESEYTPWQWSLSLNANFDN